MLKTLIAFTTFCLSISSILMAGCGGGCCQSVDVSVGWRRDNLDWKTNHLEGSYIDAIAKSNITFKDINCYTISARSRWVGSAYYVRLAAEYGWTYKGRAPEAFKINSPYLCYCTEAVNTDDPVKRRSEVYDFNGAVGYPLALCSSRLSIVPLIGFSFHRQHLRVKGEKKCCSSHSSSSSSCYSYDFCHPCSSSSSSSSSCNSSYCKSSSSTYFDVCSSNPFKSDPSSNPFSSYSSPGIAHELGLFNRHHTSNFRFTWYGFYLGADIAYGFDSCWTLFSELEYHFYDNCHRHRKSWTGVSFVDDHHKKGWAYGFNGVLGVNYCMCNCWYGTLQVDFRWWKAPGCHDTLYWKMVGARAGLGYVF